MKHSTKSCAGTSRKHRHAASNSCLETIHNGNATQLFELLPKIGVLRDERLLQPLVDMLGSSILRKRQFAAMALGALKDPRAITDLCRCLKASQAGRRRSHRALCAAIIQTLGEIGSDHSSEALSRQLRDAARGPERTAWRARIVESLGRITQQGGTKALAILMQLAAGRDARLCSCALHELAVAFWHRPNEVPEKVMWILSDRLEDPVRTVQTAALEALESLAHLGNRHAERALQGRI